MLAPPTGNIIELIGKSILLSAIEPPLIIFIIELAKFSVKIHQYWYEEDLGITAAPWLQR